jgi:nitroreductase
MMNDQTAITLRHSRRTFTEEPIPLDIACKLHDYVDELNDTSAVDIRFITNNGDAFNNVLKTYGYFTNVRNYFLLITKKDSRQSQIMAGYFGEKVVLYATKLGLNTCWVGGLFDKKACPVKYDDDEEILLLIAVGYSPAKSSIQENLVKVIVSPKTKKPDELYAAEGSKVIPDWFLSGIAAVAQAPSSYNRQPVKFIYQKDGSVSALITHEHKMAGVDLGIAKLHFEIGSGRKFS